MNPNQIRLLQNILGQTHLGSEALAVFDLDSTLYDVSPRLTQIVLDFANQKEIRSNYPKACEVLMSIQFTKSDWGVRRGVERLGLVNEAPDFYLKLKEHWMRSFFSNHYVQFDKPFEGSVEFVNRLQAAGVHICYLTGRDEERMLKGTLDSLNAHGFPFGESSQSQLVMKPKAGEEDAEFKSRWFQNVIGKYKKIWFFENEPINIRHVQEAHPDVEIIFFESTHSSREEPHPDWPRIQNFIWSHANSFIKSK